MSTHISMPFTDYFPPNVLDFATRRKLADLLDPLRLALDRLFPVVHSVQVRLEEDPEIRDESHVVFRVQVSRADVPDFGAAKRRWHEELFRLCPAPLVCYFRLTLERVP